MKQLAIISNLGEYIGTFVLKFLTEEIILYTLALSLPDLTQFIHRVLKTFKTTLNGPSTQLRFLFRSFIFQS